MTAKEYIESGAIEACIMGLADEKDMKLQEVMEQMYPEVKEARMQMEVDMENAAMSQSVPVGEEVGKGIMKTLQHEWREREPVILAETPVVPIKAPVDTSAPKPIRWFRSVVAASVLLLMASTLINFYYYSKFADYRTRYKELLVQQNALLTRQSNLEAQLTVMKDPVMKQVKLEPASPDINSVATVYWNANTSEVYLMVNNMPKPASGKQYQLWAQVDGKMVDAGLLDMNADNLLHKMKSFKDPQAFAITIEPAGGSPTPTYSTLQVIGKVTASS
jgi:anti-sigma-K factor RskA